MIVNITKNRDRLCALLYAGFLGVIAMLLSSHGALAASATAGDMIGETADVLPEFAKLIAAISYVLGAGFVGLGVYKMRDWSNSPQQHKISDPIKFLGAGGLLVAAPAAASVLANSIGMDASVAGMETSATAALPVFASVGAGLDGAIVSLVRNIAQPMSNLIMGFAYVAGAALTVVGIVRLTKSAQEGPRGPSGLGTMSTFMAAAILLSASQVLGTFSLTLFGTGADQVFVYNEILGLSGVPTDQAQNIISAILGFMAIVGMISFLRGIFVMRGFAEGNSQMTLMGGLSHIIAGVIAVNLGRFLNIIETTLGISLGSTTSFNIVFS